jgi:hypothetical protein
MCSYNDCLNNDADSLLLPVGIHPINLHPCEREGGGVKRKRTEWCAPPTNVNDVWLWNRMSAERGLPTAPSRSASAAAACLRSTVLCSAPRLICSPAPARKRVLVSASTCSCSAAASVRAWLSGEAVPELMPEGNRAAINNTNNTTFGHLPRLLVSAKLPLIMQQRNPTVYRPLVTSHKRGGGEQEEEEEEAYA